MADWKFYGQKEQLTNLKRMLDRKRWFFARVTGRRRIGKKPLIRQAIQECFLRMEIPRKTFPTWATQYGHNRHIMPLPHERGNWF